MAGVGGCGPAEATVGSLLEPLRAKVNAILVEAGTQGQALLVTAAGQVDLAVSNAESAFADELNTAIDKVDDATRRSVEQLQALVGSLSDTSAQVLKSTIDGSQQLLNSLPLTNKNPQVRDYTPKVVSTRSADVQIRVMGNFYYAMESGKAVQLKAGSATYAPTESTTTQVGFTVPAGVLTAASGPDKVARVSVELTAPYEKGVVFKTLQPGTFRLLLTTLPTKPVTSLLLANDKTVTGLEQRALTQPPGADAGGPGWRVNSVATCNPESDSHTFSATSGWRIVPSTVSIHYIARGYAPRAEATVVSASVTAFTVAGHTIPNCDWTKNISWDSGDMTYYVTYVEQRSTTTTSNEVINLMAAPYGGLSWGDQVVVPVSRGGWTVTATLWDGTKLSTAGTDQRNPYLKVTDQGDNVKVELVSAEKLTGV
jgi:hypothetical protein